MSIKKIFSSVKNRLFQSPEFDYINNSVKEPSSKNILKTNGGNIIYKDYSNYITPTSTSAYGFESKINELECKILSLEQKNENLLSRLDSTEQMYELKIRKLEKNNLEDKNSLIKAEQAITLLTQRNNEDSNDLKKKLGFIHNSLQKEEEYKNEQRKIDIELQRNILNQITEKLGEAVKAEVDARFKADMETKSYNQNIYNNMENNINKLKKEIEDINKQVHSDIKIVSKDCSERAHNISKYIDQKLLDAVVGKNDSIDKIKAYIDQVVSQVRTNITYQNEQNKLFDQRLKSIEVHTEKSKNDNFGYMAETEKRFDTKMNYLKTYFEVNIQKHNRFLDETIKNMANTMDKNIDFIVEQIIKTRIKENEVYEKLNESNDNKFKSIIHDLEKICERVYQYENSLNVFDKQNELLKKNFSESLAMIKSKFDVHIVNQKILYTVENNVMQEQITYLKNKLENSNADLINNLKKMDSGSQNSISSILLQLDKHEKMINSSNQINKSEFKRIDKRSDENEVKELINEMLNNIESKSLFDSLIDSKKLEEDFKKKIKIHQENIDKLNNETSINKKATDSLGEKINDISKQLNTSGSDITKAMKDILKIRKEAEELEIRESVSKLMDVMLTNIENEITNEKMNDMNKFNLQSMTTNITDLKNKISSLTTSTNTNTTDISNLKNSVESIKKRGLDTQGNHSNCSIKIATNQMLNNVEFNNIYSLLKEGIKNSPIEFTDEMKAKCGELVDNKIQTELEKIKLDNQKLWSNAVDLIQKFNKPGEVQQIINKVPPTIIPINESSNRLLDVDYYNGKNSKPKVPDLDNKLKSMESEQDENLNSEISNALNNNINDKNDKEIENDADMVQIETNPENDKNSKNSKGSKKSKNSKGSKNSQNSKGSKNSKNSKGSQISKNSKGSKNSKKENEPNVTSESKKKETNEEGEEYEEEEEDEDEEGAPEEGE